MVSTELVTALLVLVAFLGGVGTTTLGPGGIFVTIALYTFTSLPSATVAGTASATFIGTGLIGTATYTRSGELRGPHRNTAIVLAATSVIGALAGSEINANLPDRIFGLLLAAFVTIVGINIVYREYNGIDTAYSLDLTSPLGLAIVTLIGLGVGTLGGLLGVGGPAIAVPVLVIVGTPILAALAVAQVQSVVLAAVATANYASHQAVSAPYVVLIAVPHFVGAVVGWRVAHLMNPDRLKFLLGLVLVCLGPVLAF